MNTNYHFDKSFWIKPISLEDGEITQIGRLYCKPYTVVDEHLHSNLFELTVVTGGEGIITTNGVETRVKRGDIYLSMPCDMHKIESDGEKSLKFDYIAFTVKHKALNDSFEELLKNNYSPSDRAFKSSMIETLVSCAIAEFDRKESFKEELMSSVLRQILIYTVRDFKTRSDTQKRSAPDSAEALSYQIMNYIETHIFSIKNLTELEKLTDYSYGYLSAVFKKTTKLTLSSFFKEKKLEAARIMIIEDRVNITEISEMLHYSSVYAFSKAFKEQYGISPKNYQMSFKNKDL